MSATSYPLLLITLAVSVGCSSARSESASFTPADDRAIRTLDSTFVAAWLRDDTTAVLATIADDAVLMPVGQYPLTSKDAVKAFWWPTDGSRTRILTFSRVIDDLDGAADVAYMRGTDTLTYTYANGGPPSQMVSRSMTLAVLRKQADGQWRYSRMMWGARTR
jgi:uncharacterized protein (TIGR02246 family)